MTKIQDHPELIKQAAQAYLYGYPLVYKLKEIPNSRQGQTSLARSRSRITGSAMPANCTTPLPISSRPTSIPCIVERFHHIDGIQALDEQDQSTHFPQFKFRSRNENQD